MSRSIRWYTSLHRLALLTALSVPLVAPIEAGAQAPNARLERGRYLVELILGCGNCHTPKAPEGGPIASRNLSGGGLSFSAPPFAGGGPNFAGIAVPCIG